MPAEPRFPLNSTAFILGSSGSEEVKNARIGEVGIVGEKEAQALLGVQGHVEVEGGVFEQVTAVVLKGESDFTLFIEGQAQIFQAFEVRLDLIRQLLPLLYRIIALSLL